MRAVVSASWAALGLFGCARTVVLGSECPDEKAGCALQTTDSDASVAEPPGDGEDAANGSEDANGAGEDAGSMSHDAEATVARDADMLDASPEASMDADVLVALVIENPGFQRSGNGGLGGDLVLSSLLGTLIPVPTIKIIFADLPNWYACWPLSVSSWTRDPNDAGAPDAARNDYLSFVINEMPVPVRQALLSPMQVGTTYALKMDVLSQPDNGARLRVDIRGSADQCGIGTLLGSSPLIAEDAGWTTTCVEFTPKIAYDHLIIVPAYDGGVPTLAARLLLDNVRQVVSCSNSGD